jgi:hypothetical protein
VWPVMAITMPHRPEYTQVLRAKTAVCLSAAFRFSLSAPDGLRIIQRNTRKFPETNP